VYLRLEAEGLGLLPVAERRKIAKQIEADAGIHVVSVSEGSALLIQVKTARKELDERLKKLERAETVIVEDSPDDARYPDLSWHSNPRGTCRRYAESGCQD
jgi:hypothetical protein